MKIKVWNIEEMTGYKPITRLYEDFSIADKFGEKGINSTYKMVMKEWKDNYKYLTELVMVLNWKIWEHYENNEAIARLYDKLWKETDKYAIENLKDEELKYFFRTTD